MKQIYKLVSTFMILMLTASIVLAVPTGIATTVIPNNDEGNKIIPTSPQYTEEQIQISNQAIYPAPPPNVRDIYISDKSADKSTDIIDISIYKNQTSSPLHISKISDISSDKTLYDPGLGINIYPNPRIQGVYAGQEIHPDYELPEVPSNLPSLVLYAPTMAAPNANPLEVTTIYYRWNRAYNPNGITEKGIGIWDHSKGYFVKNVGMDANNISRYTANFAEGRLYFATIMKSGREWQALLYNFNIGNWEKIYSTTDTQPAVTNGWDSWETKNFNDVCPYVPKIESTNLQVYDKGGLYRENGILKYTRPGWYLVTSKYGFAGQDSGNCNYKYDILSQFYHWKVSSPYPDVVIPLAQ